MAEADQVDYAGFLSRLAATLVDTLLLFLILTPLNYLFSAGSYIPETSSIPSGGGGIDWSALLVNDLLPMVLIIFFWVCYRATPGKMLMDCQVVDATTLENLRPGQALLRYVGYFLSLLPLGLGFLWILWDKQHRGFHDLIAHTVVLRLPINHSAGIEAAKTLEQLMKEVE